MQVKSECWVGMFVEIGPEDSIANQSVVKASINEVATMISMKCVGVGFNLAV